MVYEDWSHRRRYRVYPATLEVVSLDLYLSDYPGCKADGSDLRFTDDAGTPLNYFTYEVSEGSYRSVYLKISMREYVTVHWGNPDAVDASDGANTFPFFEDFNDTLANSGWSGDTSDFTVADGQLKGTSATGKVIYKTLPSSLASCDVSVKARITTYEATGMTFGMAYRHSDYTIMFARTIYEGNPKYTNGVTYTKDWGEGYFWLDQAVLKSTLALSRFYSEFMGSASFASPSSLTIPENSVAVYQSGADSTNVIDYIFALPFSSTYANLHPVADVTYSPVVDKFLVSALTGFLTAGALPAELTRTTRLSVAEPTIENVGVTSQPRTTEMSVDSSTIQENLQPHELLLSIPAPSARNERITELVKTELVGTLIQISMSLAVNRSSLHSVEPVQSTEQRVLASERTCLTGTQVNISNSRETTLVKTVLSNVDQSEILNNLEISFIRSLFSDIHNPTFEIGREAAHGRQMLSTVVSPTFENSRVTELVKTLESIFVNRVTLVNERLNGMIWHSYMTIPTHGFDNSRVLESVRQTGDYVEPVKSLDHTTIRLNLTVDMGVTEPGLLAETAINLPRTCLLSVDLVALENSRETARIRSALVNTNVLAEMSRVTGLNLSSLLSVGSVAEAANWEREHIRTCLIDINDVSTFITIGDRDFERSVLISTSANIELVKAWAANRSTEFTIDVSEMVTEQSVELTREVLVAVTEAYALLSRVRELTGCYEPMSVELRSTAYEIELGSTTYEILFTGEETMTELTQLDEETVTATIYDTDPDTGLRRLMPFSGKTVKVVLKGGVPTTQVVKDCTVTGDGHVSFHLNSTDTGVPGKYICKFIIFGTNYRKELPDTLDGTIEVRINDTVYDPAV